MIAMIFDTETTDLVQNTAMPLEKQPKAIEFAALLVDLDAEEEEGCEIDSLEFLCDPGMALTDEIKKITNISQEMVDGQPKYSEHAERVQAFASRADCVIAHNLAFDMDIINFESQRLGVEFEWPARKVCTVEQTIHLKGFRLNLRALHDLLFGEEFSGAHRAMVDVRALSRCAVELRRQGLI